MFDTTDVVEALAVLDAVQLYVIVAMFWDDCTESAVAAELTQLRQRTYSRDRVHQIKRTALSKMHRHLSRFALAEVAQ